MTDAPCSWQEATQRAHDILTAIAAGQTTGQYLLGAGDYRPHDGIDLPWTTLNGKKGSDCSGFAISYCWKLPRKRLGFNLGGGVQDWINSDSALQDARTKRVLFELAPTPRPGDLLIYPSVVRLGRRILIGHVSIVLDVPAEWDPGNPQYHLCKVAQCHGPNGFKPGVVYTDGSIWQHHDSIWPKPEHRSAIVRPKERP